MQETAGGLREQKRLETWRAIRAAAVRLIGERGFDAVSVEEIAAAARIAKRTFFNYFESKEAVLFDPDPGDPAHWQAVAALRPADESPWDSLQEFFVRYLSECGPKLAVQKELIAVSPELAQRSRATSERLNAFVDAWLAERVRDVFDRTLLVNAAFTVVNTAFAQWDPPYDFDDLRDLIRRGFAAVRIHQETS